VRSAEIETPKASTREGGEKEREEEAVSPSPPTNYGSGECRKLPNRGKCILVKFELENGSDDKDFGNF